MSRCFPFPPPGYEKTRIIDVDLLKKEKHKEKKNKKENKGRDKKEKKEKKKKDGSEEKHRDKKDKKDKKEKLHDKKKDKEKHRDKDKDKKNVATEKKFQVQNEGLDADKLIQKEHKRRDKNSFLSEKFNRQHTGHSGEKIRQSSHLVEEGKDSKFIQEFDRRIKHDAGGGGTQTGQKIPVMGLKDDEATVKVVAKGNALLFDVKEKVKGIHNRKSNGDGTLVDACPSGNAVNRKSNGDGTLVDACPSGNAVNRKSDGHGTLIDACPSGNAVVQNHVGNFQPRVEGLPRTLEKSSDKMLEGKEAIKQKKDYKQGEKRKDRGKEKKGHGKDKDRDKEKNQEEKAKEQLKHKNLEHKLKESNKVDPFHTNSFLEHPKESITNADSEENLKKRKSIDSNGVLNTNYNWPNKLPRPSCPLSENGRKLEPSRTSVVSASDISQGAATANSKVDEKGRNKNSLIEVPPFSFPSSKTVVGSTPPNQVAGVSVKSPHSDTKYLKQVYSVPVMETWSELDDQEWLFSSSSWQLSKPKVEPSAKEIPQVWAEALLIEQADVCALPYVIPY